MKTPRFFSILSITMLSSLSIAMRSSACFAQTVSDVSFEQRNDKVKITYSLDKQADISVCLSEDGGKTWSSPLKQVSGDVGRDVQAGAKTIWWDALSEVNQIIGTSICFRVIPQTCGTLTFVVNGYTLSMVYVQGGDFIMGATPEQGNDLWYRERTTHTVTLSDYYIGKYEVTQALWEAVMGTTIAQQCDKENYLSPLPNSEGKGYPMYYINWGECQEFIRKLNRLLSQQLEGKRFALPTEAQWEYAARGGQKSKHYRYAGSDSIDVVAWYGEKDIYDNGMQYTGPHPVGQKQPNELGLYDMTGNVEEWCYDWMDDYPSTPQINPIGPSFGTKRVVRGGYYGSYAQSCRISFCSYGQAPSVRHWILGFRLVLLP